MNFNAFCKWAVLVMLSHAPQVCANVYSIVDLGAKNKPVSVNRVNVIIGNREPFDRGQIYRGGRWRNLPTHSDASAINRDGDVAGVTWNNIPMLWPHSGEAVSIVVPNGSVGSAVGVNDSDFVAGSFFDAESEPQCYLWSATTGSIDIGEGGFLLCTPTAINNFGQMTGGNVPIAGGSQHAFFWDNGFVDVGVLPGGVSSKGLSINDFGAIVGVSFGSIGQVAFLWEKSVLTSLDPDAEFYASEALSLNKRGDIVGWTQKYNNADEVAVRFEHGKVLPLDSEVSNLEDWQLQTAVSINDKGVIVGVGLHTRTGEVHSYMLLPQK